MSAIWDRAPEFPDLNGMLGRLYFESADHELAVKHLEKALEYRPDDNRWRTMYGMACVHIQAWPKAQKAFQEAAEQSKHQAVERWKGLVDCVVAGTLAGKALHNYVRAINHLVAAADRKRMLVEALGLSSDFVEAKIELATLSRDDNEFDRAMQLAIDADTEAKTPKLKVSAKAILASTLFTIERYSDAAKTYNDALLLLTQDDPMRPVLLDFLSKCEFMAGNYADAERLQAEAIMLQKLINGELFEAFQGHRDALSQMPNARRIPDSLSTALHLSLRSGERLRLRGQIGQSSEGEGVTQEDIGVTNLDVELYVLESPNMRGFWKIAVEVKSGLVDQSLIGRRVVLNVAPTFGLESEEWEKKANEESFVPSALALESFQYVRFAIMELFTCGLGRAELSFPFVWSNMAAAGPLHLK
ncbi:MAG: tetratricopeptide repeat protein, partial [Planctomycetes bacterium]|nr:tetratricopeptide repeat protein [Planctomycetota bacterium]